MPTPLDVVLGHSDRKPWTVKATYEVEIEVWASSREDAIRRAAEELPGAMYESAGDYSRTATRSGITAFFKALP